MSEQLTSRSETLRQSTRRRLIAAARTGLSFSGEVTPQLVADICDQTGLHPTAFRTFFPSDDSLLDAVNVVLVEECASRLKLAVDQFSPPDDRQAALDAAAVALARSRPVDRGGLMIRSRRRLAALGDPGNAHAVVEAERQFVGEVADTLSALMVKMGQPFSWPEHLAVRVILDTYERSFEAWMLAGNDEFDFHTSPYVQRTLPALFEGMTAGGSTGGERAQQPG